MLEQNIGIFLIAIIVIIVAFLIYQPYTKKLMREGLTTQNATNPTAAVTAATQGGESANSDNYASTLKTMVTKLQDTLLLSKYKTNYESIIISLDDLVNQMMLKTVLDINLDVNQISPAYVSEKLTMLNTLHQSKGSFNAIMKYIDSTTNTTTSKYFNFGYGNKTSTS